MDTLEEVTDIDGLAAFLKVSRRTIHKLLQHGDAPRSFSIGKARRFRREDIEQWMSERAEP